MPDDSSLAETVTAVASAGTSAGASPARAARRDAAGRRAPLGHIGRYALRARIGEGGLGVVWSAHDPLLARSIAVKTIELAREDSERAGFHDAFLNEARAVGALAHPHIVTVHDAGIDGSRAWIAMELLKGRDLRQLRHEGWRATPAQAALICRRVADALAFAHAKGVVHRDIKPANIFMVGRTQPRVLDFGIARIARPSAPGGQDAGDGADADPMRGAGSPHFMSPEQHRGEAGDRRVDIYALGVVLHELLADRKPYVGDTLAAIRAAVLAGGAPTADRVDASVPAELAAIAARAMAVDPDLRFRSARSLSRALRAWIEANPDESDPGAAVPTAPGAIDDASADDAPKPAPSAMPAEPPPIDLAPAAAAVPGRAIRGAPVARAAHARSAAAAPSIAASLRTQPRRARLALLVGGTLAAMALAASVGVFVAQRTHAAPVAATAAAIPAFSAPTGG